MEINEIKDFQVAENFIKYVQIDTQSDEQSQHVPSTEKQKDLSRLLVEELQQIGITDAHVDPLGYVYATIPSNSEKTVPVVCFCSHVDTSPDSSGTGVIPIIHHNYQGEDLVLPQDPKIIIKQAEHPDLSEQHGNDIITASGKTLLGADDKAGVAEIMDAARILMENPSIKHGVIKILFTPDEEIGRGVDHVDLVKLGADYAYTMDGEKAGTLEDETFSADGILIKIQGISIHPGYAKNKMVSALKIAAAIIENLPKDRLSPESTQAKEGFVHPTNITGAVEEATLNFIVRDHDTDLLAQHEAELKKIVQQTVAQYPGATFDFEITEQYRNMKEVLDKHPRGVDIAMMGIERAGMKVIKRSIRGGTDGSRLSFMGLPCPNIFAGGHAFHGKQEWVSIQDMQKAVLSILHISALWEELS